jgi:hypothetical protein
LGVANTSVNIVQINANTTAIGGDYCIRQRVELVNVSDLAGKLITASFWYKSSRTGTHGARVIGALAAPATVGGGDQALPFTVNAANVWEYKTLVFNVATAFITSWGSTSNNAGALLLDIGFRTAGVGQSAAVVGDFFRVTAVQLEQGSVATPFERRPIGLELALCQRYFEVGSNRHRVDPFPGSLGANVFFAVTKRVSPTITTVTNLGTLTLVSAEGLNSIFLNYTAGVSGNVAGTWTASAEI